MKFVSEITLTGKPPGMLFACFEKYLEPSSDIFRLRPTPRWSDAGSNALFFCELTLSVPTRHLFMPITPPSVVHRGVVHFVEVTHFENNQVVFEFRSVYFKHYCVFGVTTS
jgi:hypothetical protein